VTSNAESSVRPGSYWAHHQARRKEADPHATRFGKFSSGRHKVLRQRPHHKSDQCPTIRLRGAVNPLDTEAVTTEISGGSPAAVLDAESTRRLHKFGLWWTLSYDYDEQNRFA